MAEMGEEVPRKRLLVVAADALGWRVQSNSLISYLKENNVEIDVSVLKYKAPPILRVCMKDVYVKTRRRRLGLFSSMLWAKLAFSRRLKTHVDVFRPDSILFLGHFSAAGRRLWRPLRYNRLRLAVTVPLFIVYRLTLTE